MVVGGEWWGGVWSVIVSGWWVDGGWRVVMCGGVW